MTQLDMPKDLTPEENVFIDLVKIRMLSKLTDRNKFIFLYVLEMGHTRREAADVLHTHFTAITRDIRNIRKSLSMYRNGIK